MDSMLIADGKITYLFTHDFKIRKKSFLKMQFIFSSSVIIVVVSLTQIALIESKSR